MKEEWVFIDGYEDKYMVSNMGRIKCLDYKTMTYKLTVLKPNRIGYLACTCCKNGLSKNYLVHRLVAKYFIPNPNNLPFVNHINENKGDARFFNLEWCSQKHNMNVGTVKVRKKEELLANRDVVLRPVILINTGEYFRNINRASCETGVSIGKILESCRKQEFIYDDYTFSKDILFMYYDDIKNIIHESYNLDIECEDE